MRALLIMLIAICPVLCGCGHKAVKTSKELPPATRVFIDNFDDNSNGWLIYDNTSKPGPLVAFEGVLYSFSPWWIDYNHAPPGGGYLHIIAGLHTNQSSKWVNKHNLPQDFTNAKVTIRLRGQVDLQGANLLFHIQATNDKTTANFVLKGQPFAITPDWSEQTVQLVADPNQWQCIGSRADRTETYGSFDVRDALTTMNVDFIFVLFPLTIEPAVPMDPKQIHVQRAGYNYPVKQERLPRGVIMIDWVKIEFPNSRG